MKRLLILIIFFIQFPLILFAHGSHGSGFMAGFTHPILGLDHNLAILGVGLLSYILDPKKWFLYPVSFLLMMIAGGLLGIGEEATTLIEKIIALSVFLIGLSHLKKSNSGNYLIVALIGVFGFFHGYAHGAEMPETTTAIKYTSGFSIGTIILSFIGYRISKKITSSSESTNYITLLAGILMGAGIVFLWP